MSRANWIPLVCLLLLCGVACAVRVQATSAVVEPDGIWLRDNDTLRRLEFTNDLADPAKPYPWQNPKDGYPDGSVIHWTLPMSWAIAGLDAVLSASYPGARPYELGALWTGVVIGTLSVFVFGLLVWRLLGRPWPALLAAALYALARPTVGTTELGNGDHQSLQSLLCILTLVPFAIRIAGRGGTPSMVVSGLALGSANWVSTESMVVLQLMAVAAVVHVAMRRDAVMQHVAWVVPAILVILVGDAFEHASWPSLEWDKVSAFQAWQLLVLLGFLVLVHVLQRFAWRGRFTVPGVAAAISVLFIGLGPLLHGGLRARFAALYADFTASNAWVQSQVEEYSPLLYVEDTFVPSAFGVHLGLANYLLPLFVWGWFRSRALDSARLPIAVIVLGLFVLTLVEVKLAHVFLILAPLLCVVGGGDLLEWFLRRRKAAEDATADLARQAARWIAGVSAVLLLLPNLPEGEPKMSELDRAQRDVFASVRELAGELEPNDEHRSVLALWTDGAGLMYYADAPVVASGYHRNLAGIHDSWRAVACTSFEQAEPILRARRVRFVVSMAQPEALLKAPDAMPELGPFADRIEHITLPDGSPSRQIQWTPGAVQSLWWQWHTQRRVPGFRMVFRSEMRTMLPGPRGMLNLPMYRVWRVVYPEER